MQSAHRDLFGQFSFSQLNPIEFHIHLLKRFLFNDYVFSRNKQHSIKQPTNDFLQDSASARIRSLYVPILTTLGVFYSRLYYISRTHKCAKLRAVQELSCVKIVTHAHIHNQKANTTLGAYCEETVKDIKKIIVNSFVSGRNWSIHQIKIFHRRGP